MAFSHPLHPLHSLQFHPESCGSEFGGKLLLAFICTIIGALSHCSRRPLVLLVPVILFEIWNGQANISLLTSSAHMVAITYGYAVGYYLERSTTDQRGSEKIDHG